MMNLTQQVQRISDNCKNGIARLARVDAPRFADIETTFAELKQRIEKTIAFLKTITPAQLEGSDSRKIALNSRLFTGEMTGKNYLLTFLLPNFYFHLTTLHDILRHNGLNVGKADYLGSFD